MNRRPRPNRSSQPALAGRVRDVTQAGEAVIETEQGLVMARGGLPGEQVRVLVEARSQGVLRGSVVEVTEASPDRVAPACGLAERCGGCPLMALQAAAARRLKLAHVQRAIEGVCAPGVVAVMEDVGAALHYRRRVRMSFRRVGGQVLLGYRAAQSHTIVDVASCPVLETQLDTALGAVRARLLPHLQGTGEIELQRARGEQVVVSVDCDQPATSQVYKAAQTLSEQPSIAGVALRVEQGAAATYGVVEAQSVGLDGLPLRAAATGFSQANSAVNRRLSELVVELAQPASSAVLELYAGHGNFTVALAPLAASLWAVEADARAAESCRANLAERGLASVRVIAGSTEQLEVTGRFDVLVLDPPRAGAASLATLVARHKPARVVYVSCHMTTLGRDLRALRALGFLIDRAHVLDMFPQTAHVEAVVRLVRGPASEQA